MDATSKILFRETSSSFFPVIFNREWSTLKSEHNSYLIRGKLLFILRGLLCLCFAISISTTKAADHNPPLERVISITLQNERTDEALRKISHLAEITFSYSATAFDVQKTVTRSFTDKTVREILESIFQGEVQYKQKSNYIILTKADKIIVSGYVVDEMTGQRLKEVSIYDPVSLRSVVTDEFGFFEMELNKPTAEEMRLTINKRSYTDTLVVVPSRKSSFQHISLNFDKQRWQKFADSVDSKLNKLWHWAKNSTQKINMMNIRDTLYRKGQVSFLPFLGTNHKLSGNVVNDYSVNILGGYSAGTRKAELGGLFNIDRGDVRYFQGAGLFNANGGAMTGVQMAGLFNANMDSVKAGQFAGLINFNLRSSEGAQFAGLINVDVGSFTGPQFAGLFNFVTDDVRGVQAAGLFNITAHQTEGTQLAGLFNINGRIITGSQVSGFVNAASIVRGTQVGFINIADSVAGVPIGFLSFVSKGYHKFEIAADEIFPFNASFRTGVRQFYNIFTAGVRPEAVDTLTWSFGYGVGTAPRLSKKLSLNIDVTSNHLVRGHINSINLLNKLFVGVDIHLTKKFSIVAGPVFTLHIFDKVLDPKIKVFDYYTPTIVHQGSYSSKTNYQTWWGAKIGVRFF